MTMTVPLAFDQVQLAGTPEAVSFDVPAHTTVAVLGEDAALIDRLASFALGLDEPARGQVLVFGEVIARMPRGAALAFRRRVGYFPAGAGLLQNLSLTDNIALPLRFGSRLRDRDIDGRVRVMVAMLRLQDAATLRPAGVNEEQRRRAALARALAFDPELVILERPFDGLTNRAAAELLEIARGGETAEGARRTLLITGHDLPDILRPRIEIRHRIVRGRLAPD